MIETIRDNFLLQKLTGIELNFDIADKTSNLL